MIKRPRNDPRQYDDLADVWWDPHGEFAALHWIAAARADVLPHPPVGGGLLLDIACGGGLLAVHVPAGYVHVGVDLVASGLRQATAHGVVAAQADATALPFSSGTFSVVVAGEIFEHVEDLDRAVSETCRVLAPGGTVILDTIADTRWARFSLVVVGERLPGGPPRRCHDPKLFVNPDHLRRLFATHGVDLELTGLAPHPGEYLRFLATRRGAVRMRRTRSLSALYQGVGMKRPRDVPTASRVGRIVGG